MALDLLGPDGRPLESPSENDELRGMLQEAVEDRRVAERRAEMLAYAVLDRATTTGDLEPTERIALAKLSRDVWQKDPQAGAAADLRNDFTFGRGVPKPRCKSKAVQQEIDDAWEDSDNKLVLTSYQHLLEKGLDLTLQSNVFFLAFTGEDGRVKLGLLEHDTVKDVVRDEENRLRVLYYVANEKRPRWDYKNDRLVIDPSAPTKKVYYEHWCNVEELEAEGREFDRPPAEKLGRGKVYQLAVNKTSEMAFGVPTMRRLVRWFSAYNEFMTSRVDLVKAAAAFIMKRRIKGGSAAVERLATQTLNRSSELAADVPEGMVAPPGRAAGILDENDAVVHEALRLSTSAGDAQQDGQMIRSQISAATHFPQHYLGDAGSANLATATSMELPVLKHVEAIQEIWEGVFRWFADLVIEEAVRAGRLNVEDIDEEDGGLILGEAAEGEDPEREMDLSYEFAMPSPLKRMMGELVMAVANIAKTFDPNGTNVELSRILLGIALRDGLEVEDPAELVEKVFPPDYVDPMTAMMQQMQPPGGGETRGEDGQQMGQVNPYGAPSPASSNTPATFGDPSGNGNNQRRGIRSRTPEEVRESFTLRARDGEPITVLRESRFADLPEHVRRSTEEAIAEDERAVERDVWGTLEEELEQAETAATSNGAPHST